MTEQTPFASSPHKALPTKKKRWPIVPVSVLVLLFLAGYGGVTRAANVTIANYSDRISLKVTSVSGNDTVELRKVLDGKRSDIEELKALKERAVAFAAANS